MAANGQRSPLLKAGAGEGDDRQAHRPQPGMNTAETRRQVNPRAAASRRRRRSTGRAAGRSPVQLQHVGDEEEEQRRRQRGGDAVGDEDAEQAAEGAVVHDQAQAGQQGLTWCLHRLSGNPAERRGGRDQQQRRQDPGEAPDAFGEIAGQQRRQGGGENDADQPEALARRGQARALGGSATDIGAPQA